MHTAVAVAVAVEMNGRARRPAVAHGAKAATPHPTPRNGKAMEKDRNRPSTRTTPAAAMKPSPNAATGHSTKNRIQARRDRKIALQQDVEKLRKKLRHEENVHRALERAFTRPLGALPRLPPYLPSQTLELLAEVAVLEEEVVRLEEQVLGFRQGLYQEAIISSLAKRAYLHDGGEQCTSTGMQNPEVSPSTARHGSANWSFLNRVTHDKQTPRKPARSASKGDHPGKENQSCTTSNVPRCSAPAVAEKCPGAKTGVEDDATSVIDSDQAAISANKVAEELLTCLLTIFSQMSMSSSGGGHSREDDEEERASLSPSVSGSCDSSDDGGGGDPYGVTEFGNKDVGPYKLFQEVDAASFRRNVSAGSSAILGRRLKALLRKLSSVDLVGLSHQQRLAFWINTYNSCMMNAFLEHGAPTTPHMLVAMMPKATINVGGRVLSAMTIEHSILRLPCVVTDAAAGLVGRRVGDPIEAKKAAEGDGVAGRGGFVGLEWPDPRVTFALSCGSWSSPAVRVYTAAGVEEELEAAKRDYLKAAMGVSAPSRLAIPTLLHWFMPDLAKDVSSLMDWACLQRDDGAVQAVESGRWSPALTVPYEFRFRYLLAW